MNELWQQIADNSEMLIKGGAAIVILVIGYIIVFPIYRKTDYFLSRARKRDIAVSRGHVIEAMRVKYSADHESSHATYEYMLGDQRKTYRALFPNRTLPPITLRLYWLNNPRKVFSTEDYYYEVFSRGLPLLFLTALPWIVAGGVLYLLM